MMTTISRAAFLFLALALLCAGAGVVCGQKPEEKKPAEPAPIAAPPVEPRHSQRDILAAASIADSNPQSPEELLRAIVTLVDLDFADQAKPYLDRLIEAKLDTAALANLVAEFSSPALLKISRSPGLAPAGATFATAALEAAEKYHRDPKRLAGWIKQLVSADKLARDQAAIELFHAQSAAVGPIVAALADKKQQASHALASDVIVRLGSAAAAPLLGILDSSDAAQVAKAIELLAAIESTDAIIDLYRYAWDDKADPRVKQAAHDALVTLSGHEPDQAEARAALAARANRELAVSRSARAESEPTVELWRWNPKLKQVEPKLYRADEASAIRALYAADVLRRLDPKNRDSLRLDLVALLELAKLEQGFEKPIAATNRALEKDIASRGAPLVSEVLAESMTRGHLGAAAAAAEILGDLGDNSILTTGSGPAPLAIAARHADRRVRFAAVEAILKLKPTRPFAGSSAVAESLAFFADATGAPKALVVHPRSDRGRTIAAALGALGYQTSVRTNGREALALATESPDQELIVIHMAIDHPRADELLAQLGRDSRTAGLPVGLMAVRDDRKGIDRILAQRNVSSATPSPAVVLGLIEIDTPEGLKPPVDRMLAAQGRARTTAEERLHHATTALTAVAELTSKPELAFLVGDPEPALVRALYTPALSPLAAAALGNLSTASSQKALIDMAAGESQPIEAREAAAAALAKNIASRSLLLSRATILEQYDRYNASGAADERTQQLLSSILDALEKKSPEKKIQPSS